MKRYANYIKNLDYYTIDEIHNIQNNNYDYLISTMPLDLKFPINNIVVNKLPVEEDFSRINRIFNYSNRREKLLDNILRDDLHFELNNKYLNYKEALSDICLELQKKGLIDDNFINLLIEREETSSTAYDNFIALPHPLNCGNHSFVSFTKLNNPIIWNNQKIQFIILFSFSSEKSEHSEYNEKFNFLNFLTYIFRSPQRSRELCNDFSFEVLRYFYSEYVDKFVY
jgi:lichenan operon transcriptional antiterminator